jgi:hypothetical protein
MIAVTPYYFSTLPWSSGAKENRLFGHITLVVLLVTLLIALGVMVTDVPEQTRQQKAKIPPQLAQILEAQEPLPVVMPEPEPRLIEQAPESIVEQPEPEPEVMPELIEPEPTPVELEQPVKPAEVSQEEKMLIAKQSAAKAGVMAFSDDLASLRDNLNLNNLADTELTEGAGEQATTTRKLIGQKLDSTSGGIDTSTLSTNVGARGQLEGRKTTEFNAPTEGAAALATQRIETEAQVIGDRDIESIRRAIDKNKGGVYALYRRALRTDPELQGKLTVRLTILPSGQLSLVALIDSDLEAPNLVERLLARIRLINFGVQEVKQTELEYTFNFLPF